MKKTLSLISIILLSNLIFAQINPKKCISTNITEKELKNNPDYKLIRQNLISYYQENQNIFDKFHFQGCSATTPSNNF